jgi:hypothetical protein
MSQVNLDVHYMKLMNPDFLGSWDFNERERKILTIKDIDMREVYSQEKKGKEGKPTLIFAENVKPMILSKVNSKSIASALKSTLVADWVGKKIEVYTNWEKHFGQESFVLRIKSTAPIIKLPAIGKAQAEEAIKRPDLTREFLSKHYTITDEQWKKIETARKTTK